ncbi:hypothetical protein Tco_1059518 [Tanacetum coccineum]
MCGRRCICLCDRDLGGNDLLEFWCEVKEEYAFNDEDPKCWWPVARIYRGVGYGVDRLVGVVGRDKRNREVMDENVKTKLYGQGVDHRMGANGARSAVPACCSNNEVGAGSIGLVGVGEGLKSRRVLTGWIEKMESLQDMSGCSIDQKVKYTTGSLVGKALTWWNSQIFTVSREVAVSMAGHAAYTDRYYELARLVPYLVTPKSRKIKRYVYGLAPSIRGMVTATKPKTIQKAV